MLKMFKMITEEYPYDASKPYFFKDTYFKEKSHHYNGKYFFSPTGFFMQFSKNDIYLVIDLEQSKYEYFNGFNLIRNKESIKLMQQSFPLAIPSYIYLFFEYYETL